jgi:trehalose-phosphatase
VTGENGKSARPRRSTPRALADEVTALVKGKALLVASDFDGTLAEIVPVPRDARLRDDARTALAALAQRALVAVVSGRELSDLRARVAIEGVALAGEHGGDLLLPGGERREVELSPAGRQALDGFGRYADLLLAGTGGLVERKRLGIAAHVRNVVENAPKLEEQLLARAHEIGKGGLVQPVKGKKVVELRAAGASKAVGLERVRATLAPTAFVIALGDDETDEDLFRAALDASGMAVKVGDGPSYAPVSLEGPEQVAQFLAAIAASLGAQLEDGTPRPSGSQRVKKVQGP